MRLSNPRQILAHNDDKRKKIMFDTGLEGLDETAGHLGDALRVSEEGTYHCDGVGTGLDGSPGVGVCDASNRDEWKLTNCLADGAQSVQTENRKGVRFAGRRKNWADGEVVDGQLHGLESLIDVVS